MVEYKTENSNYEKGIESIGKIDDGVIDDIISKLKELKTIPIKRSFKEVTKYGIKAVNGFEKLEKEKNTSRIKTGTLIDKLIGGGILPSKSMLVFGEPASGKSEVAYTMAATTAAIKENGVVLLIDAENSFSARRFEQICNERGLDFNEVAQKLVLFQPANWVELMFLIYSLPTPDDVGGKISLIILDSLTKLFRGIEFAGRGELNVKQPMIREIPIYLGDLAKAYESVLFITTQVYQKPVAGAFIAEWATFQPVGGVGLTHQTSYNLLMRHGKDGTQIARLTDADDVPLGEAYFVITAAGVEELPDTEKAAELIKKADNYHNQLEHALDDKKRGRKKKENEAKEQ
jgi:RecA/RadA recombinase